MFTDPTRPPLQTIICPGCGGEIIPTQFRKDDGLRCSKCYARLTHAEEHNE